MPSNEKQSTSALAKRLGLSSKLVFEQFAARGWIARLDDKWELTASGRAQGGEVKHSDKFGNYIVWPSDTPVDGQDSSAAPVTDTLYTATQLGELVDLSARWVNMLLAELGWLSRQDKGWLVTEQGIAQGAIQKYKQPDALPFALWPDYLLANHTFQLSVKALKGDLGLALGLENELSSTSKAYRTKYPANLRTADGHQVRFKSEVILDNWLYMAGIAHAYERLLPVNESVFSEFYLPQANLYIELVLQQPCDIYRAYKAEQQALYRKLKLNVVTIKDAELSQLDKVLPRLLEQQGIKTA